MGRLVRLLKTPKVEKKKIALIISESNLQRLEKLRAKLGITNRSEFIERLLEYSMEKLERELKEIEDDTYADE